MNKREAYKKNKLKLLAFIQNEEMKKQKGDKKVEMKIEVNNPKTDCPNCS